MNMNETLARIIHQATHAPVFNILEIGALPLGERPEPFHELIQTFPGSRVNAFEIDSVLCNKLNSNAAKGMTYHPVALGRKEEVRPFYMTNHPMCASLYKPDEKMIERYNNMEVAMLKSVDTIKTVSLDYFIRENKIGPVDFIKIDVQGAELEVFQGGSSTLKDVVAIVTEVEFVRIYENQPLFGNVCEFLEKSGLSFHKFLGMSGRALRPLIMNNNPNYATQHMWTDAMFIRNPMMLDSFSSSQLLKLAILASIYGSPDVTVYCIMEYDRRNGTEINRELQSTLLGGSNSSKVGRNDPCPCGSGKRYKSCHGDLRNV